MKYLAIGLFLAFTITSAQAQITLDTAQWRLVSGADELTPVNNMKWSSNDTGFFFGSDLSLTRTLDSGTDFSVLSFPKPVDTILVDTGGPAFKVYSHDHAIALVGGMAWPDQNTGFVAGMTNSDSFHAARITVLKTTDAGQTWAQFYPSDTVSVITQGVNGIIDFPKAKVGFISQQLSDGSEFFLSKTSDSAHTWTHIFQSDSLSFGNLDFINANAGLFIAHGVSYHLGYTINGTDFKIIPLPASDSLPSFVHWNGDGSWIVGIDSVYRSVDSGKHWVSVIPYDPYALAATVATFHDSVGFVFRANAPVVLHTTDYGATWKSDRLPKVGSDTVLPKAASMPTSTEAYLLGQLQQTTNVLLKIAFPPAPQQINGVALARSENGEFSALTQGSAILFTANSADRARTIDILDVLGRPCTSITLPSGATTSQLSMSQLRPGSYFARLGGAIVKFAVWN